MKKILYIQVGSGFRNPNRHIMKQLRIHFPESEIHLFDVLQIVKKKYWNLIVNLFFVLKEFGLDYLLFKKSFVKFRSHFLGTTYLFKVFSKLVYKQVLLDEYNLIFQTQCLCDSANSKGIPYFIYTDHTNLNNLNYLNIKASDFLYSNAYINLERTAYENANAIFVMSSNIKDSLVTQYNIDKDKIKLAFVGANTEIDWHNNVDKYKTQNILFVGMNWTQKGGALLVEAFKKVQAILPNAKLTIVGSNPTIDLKNCVVTGIIPLHEVAEWYNQAAVFCMPTVREPFGIVFLEAMFNRLPIVTNDVGATPYLVAHGKNGFRLNHKIDEYVKVLIELLSDPEKCKAYGDHSYLMATENYTWDNVGNIMANHIREITS